MNENVALLPELKTCPAVFAVGKTYQIMVPVNSDLLFSVTVGGKNYYDHSNGIVRSSTRLHRVSVPMEVLDAAGAYTVNYRKIIDRKPYFPETEELQSAEYAFKPLKKTEDIHIYHIADTHGKFDFAAAAASYFGDDLDVLILNGDIIDHSGKVENFELIYRLCEAVTHGGLPVIFSRGNHDLRGFCAENLAEYTPTMYGRSYYSFRLGALWGIIMDCGEDKGDWHEEYGHTVCCHEFREEETAYLEDVIANAGREYAADGVRYRIVVSHVPFCSTDKPPFDIEQPLFTRWMTLLNDNVVPQVMLAGHNHATEIGLPGGKYDQKGQTCPVVIGSKPLYGEKRVPLGFIGCAVTLSEGKMTVVFNDHEQKILNEETLQIGK